MAVVITSACADPRSIGTLVHEGPVARDADFCFAATHDARIVWVSTSGEMAEAPTTDTPLDLTVDSASGGVWALTRDALLSLHPRSRRVEDVPAEAAIVGSDRVWTTASGLLTMRAGGLWTSIDEDGQSTSRWLPEARGLWFDGDDVYWQGASHPRAVGGVLVRAEAAEPLTTASLVTSVVLPEGAVAARGATDGELMLFVLQEGWLRATRTPISGNEEAPESPPWLRETSASVIASVTHLFALTYVVALENPPSLLVIDLERDAGLPLAGLHGPVAGPVACPEFVGARVR